VFFRNWTCISSSLTRSMTYGGFVDSFPVVRGARWPVFDPFSSRSHCAETQLKCGFPTPFLRNAKIEFFVLINRISGEKNVARKKISAGTCKRFQHPVAVRICPPLLSVRPLNESYQGVTFAEFLCASPSDINEVWSRRDERARRSRCIMQRTPPSR
jgi:hypothetical protein